MSVPANAGQTSAAVASRSQTRGPAPLSTQLLLTLTMASGGSWQFTGAARASKPHQPKQLLLPPQPPPLLLPKGPQLQLLLPSPPGPSMGTSPASAAAAAAAARSPPSPPTGQPSPPQPFPAASAALGRCHCSGATSRCPPPGLPPPRSRPPARRGSTMVLWVRTSSARKQALTQVQRRKESQWTAARRPRAPQGSAPGPRARALAASALAEPRRVAASWSDWVTKTCSGVYVWWVCMAAGIGRI